MGPARGSGRGGDHGEGVLDDEEGKQVPGVARGGRSREWFVTFFARRGSGVRIPSSPPETL